MANVHGQIIEYDGASGVVESTSTVYLKQPDLVTRDATSGEELSREARPNLPVTQVHVKYEDGSTADLTECIDTWTVLGSVVIFPEIKDPANPPEGAHGELAEQREATDAALADVPGAVAKVKADLEAAAASTVAERAVEVVEDGELSVVE